MNIIKKRWAINLAGEETVMRARGLGREKSLGARTHQIAMRDTKKRTAAETSRIIEVKFTS